MPIAAGPANRTLETATINGLTIASLGLTQGSYVYTAPSGDTITIRIGASAVPEHAALAMVGLGLAGVGMVARRRMKG